MKFIAVAIAVTLMASLWSRVQGQCGQRPAAPRVVQGTTARPNSWPWMVQIEHKIHGHQCGGSLISPTWLLTAAHCLQEDKSNYMFNLGEHDRRIKEGEEQSFKAKRIILHKYYFKPTALNNDIALVELESPVRLHSKVNLVCLPRLRARKPANSKCYTAGWGLTKGGGQRAPVLQEGMMPIVSNAECQKQFKFPITSRMVCAGKGGKNPATNCQTDSGGPLMCPNDDGTWSLEGVVSFGDPKCLPGLYTGYSRVSAFRNWIKRYAGV